MKGKRDTKILLILNREEVLDGTDGRKGKKDDDDDDENHNSIKWTRFLPLFDKNISLDEFLSFHLSTHSFIFIVFKRENLLQLFQMDQFLLSDQKTLSFRATALG